MVWESADGCFWGWNRHPGCLLRHCFSLLGFLSSWRWNSSRGMTLKNNSATPLLDHSPRRAEMWVTIQAVNQLKKAVQLSLTKEPWTHVVRMKNCCSQNCSPSHHDITLHNHSLVSLILIYVPWIQPFDCGVCLVALTEKLELQGKIWKRKPFGYIWSCIFFFSPAISDHFCCCLACRILCSLALTQLPVRHLQCGGKLDEGLGKRLDHLSIYMYVDVHKSFIQKCLYIPIYICNIQQYQQCVLSHATCVSMHKEKKYTPT